MTGDRVFKPYKGYHGSIETDVESGMLYGRIEFINDLVTYTAETLKQLEEEFHVAVDDYLETCAEVGKKPEKSLSGTFNVRVGPELHKRVTLAAIKKGTFVNDEVKKALEQYLLETNNQVHIHYHGVRREKLSFGEESPYTVVEKTRIPKH